MMLGQPITYSCPHCGKRLEGPNVQSGNSLGAKYFSDGHAIMPMLPETPAITKCPGCQNFFWVDEADRKSAYELIDEIYSDDDEESTDNDIGWLPEDITDEVIEELLKKRQENLKKKANNKKTDKKQNVSPKQQKPDAGEELPWVQFLNPEELEQAIEQNIHDNDNDKELYLRKSHWHAINQRKRAKDKEIFTTQEQRLFWENNLLRIIELLNQQEMDDLCAMAEIQRNLGQFDQSIDTLKRIEGEDYQFFKETITEECKKKNRWVVELKEES